ncbi:unnamed protein product [Paramecium octaurelia]|uniref:Eukaryotic translation initiation factor 4E n=1 Tax=Paramecium octaurelia TaxID=43137 RepID=A0A8S1SYU9_PAROT|nr:unnamed protein product [Paramecium octaurelia]
MNQDSQLRSRFTFWLSVSKDQNIDNFSDQLKQIGSFGTAREFWSYYSYMVKPEKLPLGAQFFLFQEQIQPVWEDPQNMNGGRLILRVKRGFENRVWEELILHYLSDDNPHLQGVCGIIAHSKKNFILISIWIKDQIKYPKLLEELTKWITNCLGLQNKKDFEYIAHPQQQHQGETQ